VLGRVRDQVRDGLGDPERVGGDERARRRRRGRAAGAPGAREVGGACRTAMAAGRPPRDGLDGTGQGGEAGRRIVRGVRGEIPLEPELGSVGGGQRGPGGGVTADELGEVHRPVVLGRTHAGRRGREVVERAAGAGELEVDRGDAARLAGQRAEPQPCRAQRPA
jgi:hypothetical protein